jgi:sugar phosphate isomerase/epimerase
MNLSELCQSTPLVHGQLTYCSNIHPGESWPEIKSNLDRYIPEISRELPATSRFGIGLRLSAEATKALADPDTLADFCQYLQQQNVYVFTINGFPYGPFHGTRVKEDVYLPDWKDPERLRYTNQIADVFAEFLPADVTGSISTVPGAFKACVSGEDDIKLMAQHMVSHVAHLVELQRSRGVSINLALEPEPCCFLETIDESVDFFTRYLFSDDSIAQLSTAVNVDSTEALALLKKHLTLCLDLCHAAVEFEDAEACISKLRKADINIGKMQISAGLRLDNVNAQTAEILKPFDDNVYLHQVIEKHGDQVNRYKDLPDAFANLNNSTGDSVQTNVVEPIATEPSAKESSATPLHREWRVHFHVPIFLDDLGDFSSTQFFIREILAMHKQTPISDHLEVETYTWNVLPEKYRQQSMSTAIARELNWVVDQLSQS